MERDQDHRDGYVYDVAVKGRDTSFWKDTSGTSTVATDKLRLNATAISSYIQHIFADAQMGINIPNTPSGSEARKWGFVNLAAETLGAAYFEIAGSVFKCVTKDALGNTKSTTVTWNAWEAVETTWRIRWEADQVTFYANGVVLATHSAPASAVPQLPMALRVSNADSDNVDIGYVAIRRAASIV